MAGQSSESREKYVKTLRHEMATVSNYLNVEEKPSRRPRQVEEVVSFTEEDAKHVRFPHNDPLIVTMKIANMKVKRCLVDTGISMDIIYKSSFEKMKLSVKDMKPFSQFIYGFAGESLSLTGTLKLTVTA